MARANGPIPLAATLALDRRQALPQPGCIVNVLAEALCWHKMDRRGARVNEGEGVM